MPSKVEEARERLSGMAGLTFMGERARYNEQLDALIAAVREECEKPIADALGTAERGPDLVDVARNAHHAELELAQAEWDADRERSGGD
jgi:hypothetical protein